MAETGWLLASRVMYAFWKLYFTHSDLQQFVTLGEGFRSSLGSQTMASCLFCFMFFPCWKIYFQRISQYMFGMLDEYWCSNNTSSFYSIYKRVMDLGGRWNRVISKVFLNLINIFLCRLVFRSAIPPHTLISQQFFFIFSIATFLPQNRLN